MNLSPFGETIRRVEAERKSEAEAAVAAGWTEADHPEKCCPHLLTTTPQPKREGRSLEELERLRRAAAGRAKWWDDAATRAQAIIDLAATREYQFDPGMLNTRIGGRQIEAERAHKRWQKLEHAKERAKHFAHLESKYAAQIEKRNT